jgi:hypothetical protein
MSTATGNAASQVPLPGDSYYLAGTYHWGNSAASPYIGTWVWAWSGSSGNPIYIGSLSTWYVGTGFTRPIITGDNPITTSFVSSCAYDESTKNTIELNQVSYVTVSGIEFPGKCWSSASTFAGSIYNYNTTHVILSNNYFHGWTAVHTAQDNHYGILGNDAIIGPSTSNQILSNVFDNSDGSQQIPSGSNCGFSSLPQGCVSGEAIYTEGYDVEQNVFRYMSNFAVLNNNTIWKNNLTEYLYPSFDGATHSNVLNMDGAVGSTHFFLGNVMRHIYNTQAVYIACPGTCYNGNNLVYDVMSNGSFGATPTNCFNMNAATSGGNPTASFFNDTFDNSVGGCNVTFAPNNGPIYAWGTGTISFQNDHFIAYSGNLLSSVTHCDAGSGSCTSSPGTTQLFQTEAVANGQGYTAAGAYAPTAASNSSVGAGTNLSASCSTFPLCNGTGLAVAEQGGNGGLVASYPAIPILARPSAWDIGAYQFAPLLTLNVSGVGTVTSSPSGFATTTFGQYTANFQPGASITLTGAAATGHTVGNWSGAGCSTNPCTFTITTATTVNATFPPSYTGGCVGGSSTCPIIQVSPSYTTLGGSVGAGAAYTPTDFGFPVSRLTDSTWDPTIVTNTYYTTINSDAPHYISTEIAGGTALVAFSGASYLYVGKMTVNPTTGYATLAHVYPTGPDSAHGGWYANFSTEGGWTWNVAAPDVLYLRDVGGTPSFSKYDFTGYASNPSSAPVVTPVYNFAAGSTGPWGVTSSNCIAAKASYSSNNWHSLDSPSKIPGDQWFEMALSNVTQLSPGIDTINLTNGSTAFTITGSTALDTTGTLANALLTINGVFGTYAMAAGNATTSGNLTTPWTGSTGNYSFSIPVDQSTGEDVLIWHAVATSQAPAGCVHLNTGSGMVTGDFGYQGVVTGTTDRFTMHGSRLDPSGLGVFMSTDNCVPPACTNPSPMGYHYNILTGELDNLCAYSSSNRCGGHQASGFNNIVNQGGSFGQTEIRNWGSQTAYTELTDNPPLPVTNCTIPSPVDSHGSWNDVDMADSYPTFWTTEWILGAADPIGSYLCPLENEGFAPESNGTLFRFVHTVGTGQSTLYSVQNTLHYMTDDGSGDLFNSDWGGTLGTGRADIFYVGGLLSAAVTTYTLTVTNAGGGVVTDNLSQISCPSTCVGTYAAGAVPVLTATPTLGYYFAGWSGACTGTGTCSVTMSGNEAVTATFSVVVVPPTGVIALPGTKLTQGTIIK